MGADVRDMPNAAAAALPDRHREAGFDVEVSSGPHPQYPGVIVTRAICRRGGDAQRLGWGPASGKPGECRVGIANARSWRRRVRERRFRLQAEVTAIIERSGGYWPFLDSKA
jgi:hypothetical protein